MRNLSKSTWIKILSTLGIVVIGFLVMTSLGSTEKVSNKHEVKPEVRLVKTRTVNFGNLTLKIKGNGVVESQHNLNYVSEATGVVMYAKNDLKDGTFVNKGELILKIDSREVENNLFTLRSQFMNSLAAVLPEIKIEDINTYNKWYKYFQSLDIQKTIPGLPEIKNSQEKIKLSGRGIFSKFYAAKNQEILLSKYKISAPFSGYLKSHGVIRGSYVSRGQQMFSLSDARNVEIAVPLLVDEFNLLNFSGAPTVEIYSEKNPDLVLKGKIYRKESGLDRNSQTLNVYVSFTNNKLNPYFLPGNYVALKIHGKQLSDVAEIPRYLLDNDNYVFTMEEGKLARKKVDVITIQESSAIIKHTVPDNLKLVTTILQKPLIGMSLKSLNESIENEKEIPIKDSETLSQKD